MNKKLEAALHEASIYGIGATSDYNQKLIVEAAKEIGETPMADEIDEGIEVLRQVEVKWLSDRLSQSIANLGYPVGCGVAPHPEQVRRAAETLFDRYATMIEMARRARQH